jgi:translation initiation factor 2 subunit 2
MNNQFIEPANMIRLDSIDSFKIINPNVDDTQETTNNNNIISDVTIINIDTDPEKIYTLLLDEIYDTISDNNQLFGSSNANVSKPDVKYKNRKTFWYNYGKNCLQLNRSTQQLKTFFEKELAVQSSINDNSYLILRGKYNFNLIVSTFKKYIINYVQCSTCKSIQTEIFRNSSNRLDYLKCLNPKCNTCKVVVKL